MLYNCIYATIFTLMHYFRQWMLSNIIYFIFYLGMHYLHKEAPVKVIHRDLKSKNGNLLHFYDCF